MWIFHFSRTEGMEIVCRSECIILRKSAWHGSWEMRRRQCDCILHRLDSRCLLHWIQIQGCCAAACCPVCVACLAADWASRANRQEERRIIDSSQLSRQRAGMDYSDTLSLVDFFFCRIVTKSFIAHTGPDSVRLNCGCFLYQILFIICRRCLLSVWFAKHITAIKWWRKHSHQV